MGNVEGCDTVEGVREQVENLAGYEVDYLVHGTAMLEDEQTLNDAGVEAEAHIYAHCTVEGGKSKRLKMESPHAPVGTYMADHPDRYVCGKTGFTLWRTNDKGERLAIPKQAHKSTEKKEEVKASAAKGKKKK